MRGAIPVIERGLIAGLLQVFRSIDRTHVGWHHLGGWRRSFDRPYRGFGSRRYLL